MARRLRVRNTESGAVMPLVVEIDNGDGTFAEVGVATAAEAAAGANANKFVSPSVASYLTGLLAAFVGDSGSGGTRGLVPAPATGDAAAGKFLGAGGTWGVPAGAFAGVSLTHVKDCSSSITSAFGQTITFATEVLDENGAFSLASPDRFTIPADGTWRVHVRLFVTINAGTSVVFLARFEDAGGNNLFTPANESNYLRQSVETQNYVDMSFTAYLASGTVIVFGGALLSGGGGPSVGLDGFATLERLK